MHAKHRNPGNGVRSNLLGMEGSTRVHGMHNTEYRNINRGFGRGSANKPFPPPQPPRKTDIFMEAGRLAAEYLVSQGLLPPTALPEKWQNGSLNNQIGDFQEIRTQDRENLQLTSEGRTSALARLGNVNPDAGFGRRRFPDEFNAAGSRNHGRGRRKIGSFRCYSSDWGRENGNAGSLSDKSRSLSDMEGEDDFGSANNEEQQRVGMDVSGGVSEVISNELPSKSDNAGDSESELENFEFPNDIGSKASSSSTKTEVPPETDAEVSKGSDESKVLNVENAEVKVGINEDETDQEGKAADDFSLQCPFVGGDEMSNSGSDLLRLCSFAKVPTRARSSLPYKGSEIDPVPPTNEENKCDIAQQEEPKVSIEEDSFQGPSSDTLTNQTHDSKYFEIDMSRDQSVQTKEDVGDLDDALAADKRESTREQSFSCGSFTYEKDSAQDPPGFGSCSSPVKERGEKRAIQNDVEMGGTKKTREWSSCMVVDADEYFNNQNFGAMTSNSYGDSLSHDEEVVKTIDQERLVDVPLFPKGEADPGMELKEEKQPFPNSFKICDLNLMEATDMTESYDTDPVLGLPSTLEAKKEVPVDVDLSIKNNSNRSSDYSTHSIVGKEVIIVDLEDDSTNENKAFDTSDRKIEGAYSGLGSFPNTGSTGDVPDVHDGYGLMISELLGTDITNCSSVPTDITGLHNEMGLHNEAGMLCDDDPIYLSLGEIPISLGTIPPLHGGVAYSQLYLLIYNQDSGIRKSRNLRPNGTESYSKVMLHAVNRRISSKGVFYVVFCILDPHLRFVCGVTCMVDA
ncbi:hypothetical protein BVC80_1501g12 [Macleaya cordata]|uniref:Uncharacterized protein n=1 Tax=Macleaya cordata TaxID=56857 RepID=A0A200Q129_MACCD|nr:hypothetical protein BVC80_1501g12 [Macleaya cordata]